jgi:hypothetical protein
MEVGGTLSIMTFNVPPILGAAPEAEGDALGLAEAAGELAAGELAAGAGDAALEAGGGAAEEDVAGAGLAEVAGAREEDGDELQPIKTSDRINRITRKP